MSIIVLGTVCSAAATEVFFSLFLSFIINSINSQHGTVAIIRRVGLISQLRYRSLPMIFDHDQQGTIIFISFRLKMCINL